MDPVRRIEASLHIAAHGRSVISFDPGMVISAYLPIRSEADPRPLMAFLAERGGQIAVPAIVDGAHLEFRRLTRGEALEKCGFGTVSPGREAEILVPSVLLMPLAAFDDAGNRIGYGKGYYDRAIAALRSTGAEPRLIGIAFDTQHVASIPAESHDAPLHAVLTESGLREFPLQPQQPTGVRP